MTKERRAIALSDLNARLHKIRGALQLLGPRYAASARRADEAQLEVENVIRALPGSTLQSVRSAIEQVSRLLPNDPSFQSAVNEAHMLLSGLLSEEMRST